jgi:hypothetical protein
VLLLDVRDLLLLNILKFNNRKSNAQLLEDHINRYEGKIACERTVELLEEIQAHLKAEAMMELVCSS